MNHSRLKEDIKNFSLGDGPRGSQGYRRVLLQLLGLPGHGKSSLINSCKYVLDDGGPFIEHAEVGRSGNICTTVRRSYDLTDTITLVDNRGSPKMAYFETAEMYAQLGNFLPLDEEVVWRESYNDVVQYLEEAEMEPNKGDLIVPVFVHSLKHSLPDQSEAELSTFIKNCKLMTGIYPVVVLTNKHGSDHTAMERTFRRMWAEVVVSVENYVLEDHTKSLGRTTDILTFIDLVLKNAKYLLEQPRDPKRDRGTRRSFLLNHVHNAHLDKRQKEIEREREERDERAKKKPSIWAVLFKSK